MKLHEYIAAQLAKPFKYGTLDCVIFAAEWVKISTIVDYLADLPQVSTEKRSL